MLLRHLPELFGGVSIPESFLAVDLFYLISGVVLANAYGRRLEDDKLTFRAFLTTRLIRLYPLYLLGLALGTAAAVLNMHEDPHSWWTPLKLTEAIATGLLMVPIFPGLQASGSSLDGPVWTLLTEIVSNMVWARTIRWRRMFLVGGTLLICGAGVVFADRCWNGLDVGYSADQQWGALARAGYSFYAGVVVYRFVDGRRRLSNTVPWICVGLLAVILTWLPDDDFASTFELGSVLVVFPMLCWDICHF